MSDGSKHEKKDLKAPEISPSGKKKRYIILSVILAVVVLLVGLGVYFVKDYFSYNYNEITEEPEQLGFEEVKDERIINIALFGLDTRSPDSFDGRSDAIMILSINAGTSEIKLISVMRDSLVPIEKNGNTSYNKINSAYASGGPELAIKTLNTIFDLDISEYVSVNFFKLADIIDLVGGIEVNLTESEVSHINTGVREVCGILTDSEIYYVNASVGEICGVLGLNVEEYKVSSSGTQHLNGIQATAYARIRYTANIEGTTNDYGRTDRQRYVMEQLLNKVMAMEKTQYIKLIKPILSSCETSLTYGEVFDVAVNVLASKPTFEDARVPQQDFLMPSPNAGVGSVVYYDLNFAAKLIHAFIYEDISPESFIETNGIEKYDWYSGGFTPPSIDDETEKSSTDNGTAEE